MCFDGQNVRENRALNPKIHVAGVSSPDVVLQLELILAPELAEILKKGVSTFFNVASKDEWTQ